MVQITRNRDTAKGIGLGLLVLSVCSCGPPVSVHPASGRVMVDGQPAEGALVVFHPIDTTGKVAVKPSGRVDASGNFVLSSFRPRDGAPAGEYVVAVAWMDDASKADPDTGAIPTRTRAEYANPTTSPLRARITAGKNVLPAFQLEK